MRISTFGNVLLLALVPLSVVQPDRVALAGVVRNQQRRPVINAIVTLSSFNASARTDSGGHFVFAGVSLGTHTLSIRAIGYTAATQPIEAQVGKMLVVDVELQTITTLETRRIMSAVRAEFEDRRLRNIGFMLDSAKLDRPDFVSALLNVPLTRVSRSGFGAQILLRDLSGRALCPPTAFLDGRLANIKVLTAQRPTDFKAVELIPYEQVPGKYQGPVGCGSILFWSKDFRW